MSWRGKCLSCERFSRWRISLTLTCVTYDILFVWLYSWSENRPYAYPFFYAGVGKVDSFQSMRRRNSCIHTRVSLTQRLLSRIKRSKWQELKTTECGLVHNEIKRPKQRQWQLQQQSRPSHAFKPTDRKSRATARNVIFKSPRSEDSFRFSRGCYRVIISNFDARSAMC